MVKPYILWKDIDYKWVEMSVCVLRCARNAIIVSSLSYVVYLLVPQVNFGYSIIVASASAMIVVGVTYVFMPKRLKSKVLCQIAQHVPMLKK